MMTSLMTLQRKGHKWPSECRSLYSLSAGGWCRLNPLKFRLPTILNINLCDNNLKCTICYDALTIQLLFCYFECLVVITHFSPCCTDPSVYSYISDDHIPKHTITAMFCTLHSCFKELIFFIFFSLVWSKSNMLNLFKAFQSDDGKASGIALG